MSGTQPTLNGFISFIQNVMGISTTILPTSSPVIALAYEVALEIVNCNLQLVGCLIYPLAVYNLAGSNLLMYAQDQPDAAPYDNGLPFFQYTRKQWNMLNFTPGVIQSSSDEGTSQSFVVQKAAEDFTLADIQNLQNPYGRQYLQFAQQWGGVWGLS